MSNKILAALLITTFGLTAAIADDGVGTNIVIPAGDRTSGDSGVSCSGLFDPSIMSDPGVVTFVPVFELKTFDCEPGYYLPAGDDWAPGDVDGECVRCPSDKYCEGATYVYSDADTQGVIGCPDETPYSPVGSESIYDCGRLFHLGDNNMYLAAAKKTTPSLNFDLDKDGTPDLFANMTTKNVPMSDNTASRLRVKYGETYYFVYDNTINPDDY